MVNEWSLVDDSLTTVGLLYKYGKLEVTSEVRSVPVRKRRKPRKFPCVWSEAHLDDQDIVSEESEISFNISQVQVEDCPPPTPATRN